MKTAEEWAEGLRDELSRLGRAGDWRQRVDVADVAEMVRWAQYEAAIRMRDECVKIIREVGRRAANQNDSSRWKTLEWIADILEQEPLLCPAPPTP